MPNQPWHKDTEMAMGEPHPYAKIENLGTTNKSDAEDEPEEKKPELPDMLAKRL